MEMKRARLIHILYDLCICVRGRVRVLAKRRNVLNNGSTLAHYMSSVASVSSFAFYAMSSKSARGACNANTVCIFAGVRQCLSGSIMWAHITIYHTSCMFLIEKETKAATLEPIKKNWRALLAQN